MARRPMTRRRIRALAEAVVAAALIAGVGAAANWRLAVVAAIAAGAITLTRLRYAALTAVGLLAITLALAQTGHTAGPDRRSVPAPVSNR